MPDGVAPDFEGYLTAQQRNLEQIRRLPHFALGLFLNDLYQHSIDLIPPTSSLHLGHLFIVCHKALLSALTIIGRGLPDDAGGITRRAVEAACLARAFKHDRTNVRRWLAYEARMARWATRQSGA